MAFLIQFQLFDLVMWFILSFSLDLMIYFELYNVLIDLIWIQ
jgi:hypothetical protein